MSTKLALTVAPDISDGFDSTARVAVGGALTSRFDLFDSDGTPINDRDKIGVELEGGRDYIFTLDGPVGPRLVLSITQPNTFLPGNALSAGGRVELAFTPRSDGLFFIDVAGRATDTTGLYTVTVEAAPASVIVDDDQDRLLFGTDGPDLIEGRGGNDTIDSGAGNDTVLGGTDNDIIVAGDGDDRLDGGPGGDFMQGGAGNDTYVVDSVRDTVVEVPSDPGVDEVVSSVTFALPDGTETLTGAGTANLRLDGNGADNLITGNSGNNILVGLGGADTMTGGAGNDTFVIARPGGPDITVTDFSGGDRIAVDDQLLGIGARGIDVRDLTGAILQDLLQSGVVGYNVRRAEVSIDIDGDGTREVVADLGDNVRLGLDDVLIF